MIKILLIAWVLLSMVSAPFMGRALARGSE
jgi:hypothetical protein